MARNNDRGGTTRRTPKDTGRRIKKKPCALCKDRVEWVDYKDVGMLRKYMSDRGKIRARRVSGNCTQHQRDVAIAIKTARELVLLPYTQRTTTERPGGRGGGRGGREGGYGGQGGGRRPRDEERSLSADATSSAVVEDVDVADAVEEVADALVDVADALEDAVDAVEEVAEVADAIEDVVEVTGTGDGTLTEVIADVPEEDGEG
jgi:small subunit ribosomal protein S18